MHAEWIPGSDWESFEGVIHGGIICTVLDEAMSKAILASGVQAFTVELRLRYRQKLSIGQPVQVRGWIVQKEKRRITAEGAVCGPSGEEYGARLGSLSSSAALRRSGRQIDLIAPLFAPQRPDRVHFRGPPRRHRRRQQRQQEDRRPPPAPSPADRRDSPHRGMTAAAWTLPRLRPVPAAQPTAASFSPAFRTSFTMPPRSAPSAIRIAISCARAATEKAITP